MASRAPKSLTFFVFKKQNASNHAKPRTSKDTSLTIQAMIIPAVATHGETWWTLKVDMNHYSLRSCLELSKCFRLVFNDSELAKSFSLSACTV